MYNNEILKSIDIINEAQLDAEYCVLESMIEAYDKASMILESYEGEDLSSFDIFQESVIMESDDEFEDEQTNEPVAKGNHFRRVGADGKKEKLIKSILMAIPRLFTWLAKKIKSLWNNRPAAKLKKEISDLKLSISKMNAESKRKMDDTLAKAEKYTNELDEFGLKMYDDIKRLEQCVGAHINASNKTISSYWDIDKSIENCNNMMKVIDKLGNYNFHKPSSGKFELLDDINVHHKYEPSKASKGRLTYSLDDFVNKISQFEKMTISISDKADAIATKISADLKSYDTTKAAEDGSAQKLKVDTANKILKELNRISKLYVSYFKEAHHDIVYFTKYTAFYNKVATMYATGYAPRPMSLHFKNGQDSDEARSVFNTES